MVREWTDDQRVEARERAIKQGLGRKRAYRVCPIPQCGKQIYDYQQDIAGEQDEDAMRIDDDAYMQATPALRTKSVLDKHMLSLHPNEAAAAGIVAPSLRAVERRVPDVSAV